MAQPEARTVCSPSGGEERLTTLAPSGPMGVLTRGDDGVLQSTGSHSYDHGYFSSKKAFSGLITKIIM